MSHKQRHNINNYKEHVFENDETALYRLQFNLNKTTKTANELDIFM